MLDSLTALLQQLEHQEIPRTYNSDAASKASRQVVSLPNLYADLAVGTQKLPTPVSSFPSLENSPSIASFTSSRGIPATVQTQQAVSRLLAHLTQNPSANQQPVTQAPEHQAAKNQQTPEDARAALKQELKERLGAQGTLRESFDFGIRPAQHDLAAVRHLINANREREYNRLNYPLFNEFVKSLQKHQQQAQQFAQLFTPERLGLKPQDAVAPDSNSALTDFLSLPAEVQAQRQALQALTSEPDVADVSSFAPIQDWPSAGLASPEKARELNFGFSQLLTQPELNAPESSELTAFFTQLMHTPMAREALNQSLIQDQWLAGLPNQLAGLPNHLAGLPNHLSDLPNHLADLQNQLGDTLGGFNGEMTGFNGLQALVDTDVFDSQMAASDLQSQVVSAEAGLEAFLHGPSGKIIRYVLGLAADAEATKLNPGLAHPAPGEAEASAAPASQGEILAGGASFNPEAEFANLYINQVMLMGSNISFYPQIMAGFVRFFRQMNIDVRFIDFKDYMQQNHAANLVENYETDFLILSNVDLVAGYPDWESGLMDLMTTAGILEVFMVFGVQGDLHEVDFCLPDLKSRLLAIESHTLVDYGRKHIALLLNNRLEHQGVQVQAGTVEYLANLVCADPSIDLEKTASAIARFVHSMQLAELTVPMIQLHFSSCIVYSHQDPALVQAFHPSALSDTVRKRMRRVGDAQSQLLKHQDWI